MRKGFLSLLAQSACGVELVMVLLCFKSQRAQDVEKVRGKRSFVSAWFFFNTTNLVIEVLLLLKGHQNL